MESPRHDRDPIPAVSFRAHEHMLCELGAAALAVDRAVAFAFQCVLGYPFVWVLHPGLKAGAIVAAYAELLFLDHLGYISLQVKECNLKGTLSLTPAGLARCAEIQTFQA